MYLLKKISIIGIYLKSKKMSTVYNSTSYKMDNTLVWLEI